MITISDVNIVMPTPELQEWIARYADPRLACPWTGRSWPGFGLAGIAWAQHWQPESHVMINRVIWPAHASNFARAFFLMSAEQANEAAIIAYGENGDENNAVTLYVDSPGGENHTNENVSTAMYMLSPKPLSAMIPTQGIPQDDTTDIDTNNVYLIVLVDERYYWWDCPFGYTSISDPGQDWTDLLGSATGAVTAYYDFTLRSATVNTAYLAAGPSFNVSYWPAPPVVDAIARNVGMVVTRQYDGTVDLMDTATANSRYVTDFANNPLRTSVSGGSLFPAWVYW
jgi:hypothetical protein